MTLNPYHSVIVHIKIGVCVQRHTYCVVGWGSACRPSHSLEPREISRTSLSKQCSFLDFSCSLVVCSHQFSNYRLSCYIQSTIKNELGHNFHLEK